MNKGDQQTESVEEERCGRKEDRRENLTKRLKKAYPRNTKI